jgi:NAD(P)-dependent dehydrogenase (short-subunit alcohol dehydrogenase family)
VNPTIDLRDRVAAVTGAGAGLGLAIAHELARSGARIAVLERDERTSEAAAESLAREHGVRAISIPTDVADSGSVDRAFAQIQSGSGGWTPR